MALEITIIFLLLVANGMFAMTEIAVVLSRKVRLRRMAEQGDAGARAALELAEAPNRFLSTVQVGITLVGMLAGAYGGATLASEIDQGLQAVPLLAPYGKAIGVGVVVVVITYFSLVIGELVPKRVALANPEGIARVMARPVKWLARLASPAVKLLGVSTDQVLRLLGLRERPASSVSEDEVKVLMEEGLREGVFHATEPQMVERVLALDRLPLSELMTPRAKIIWINVADPHEAIWHKIVISGHTSFPVYENNRDNVVGVVSVKAIYANLAAGTAANVRDLMTPALFVPASLRAVALLETFKKRCRNMALVTDEYGGITGLVTLHDIMEAVLGDFPSQDERLKPTAQRRDDGSWLVDAMIEASEFERLVPEFKLDPPSQRDYHTFGGYVTKRLGHLPSEGEFFDAQGFRVEVIDMDRHRVDKVLLMALGGAGQAPESEPRVPGRR
ncbi:MAG: HlyC/CorC family transporter [Verrucomicrobia bacterium]|nr:HlyC/CorC family transporter [Verrucomicrobiota bacterium]